MLDEIASALQRALAEVAGAWEVEGDPVTAELRASQRPDQGDFFSSAALELAPRAGRKPREVAQAVAERLQLPPTVERVEVAGPGFLNFFLGRAWLEDALRRCLEEGSEYGRCADGAGERVQVEFVSANPVGPLHVGNVRGGPFGDVLASLLAFTGHEVEREYYVNDSTDNTQYRLFGASLRLRYLQELGEEVEYPEDHYRAEYIQEWARELVQEHGEALRDVPDDPEGYVRFADLLLPRVLEQIQGDLRDLGIEYDVWFSERALHASGAVQREVERLLATGSAYEREGAVWLRTTEYGDDEDRVLIRSGGAAPTYIASDCAYAQDKLARGFERLIYVLGPDHAGYVPRMQATFGAMGVPLDHVELILSQIVRFLRHGEPVRLSKRKGQVIMLRELLDEIGRDATRFHFLTRSMDAHMDFDIELAKQHSEENPVYYVQYAHTRTCGIFRRAEERGFSFAAEGLDLALLAHPAELAVLRKIADFPAEVLAAARQRAPHRLTTFARDLARLAHQFYGPCKVLDPEAPELSAARLALVQGVQAVLATTCRLLGIAAPERM